MLYTAATQYQSTLRWLSEL